MSATLALFFARFKAALAVMTGRIVLPAQIEGMILMADLAKTLAALSALSITADRLLAKAQADEAALAAANQALADADAETSAQIDALTAKIAAVAPDPAAPVEPAPVSADPIPAN